MAECWRAYGAIVRYLRSTKNPGRGLRARIWKFPYASPHQGLSRSLLPCYDSGRRGSVPVSGGRLERGARGGVTSTVSHPFARAPRSLNLLYIQSIALVYHPFPPLDYHCQDLCQNTHRIKRTGDAHSWQGRVAGTPMPSSATNREAPGFSRKSNVVKTQI